MHALQVSRCIYRYGVPIYVYAPLFKVLPELLWEYVVVMELYTLRGVPAQKQRREQYAQTREARTGSGFIGWSVARPFSGNQIRSG